MKWRWKPMPQHEVGGLCSGTQITWTLSELLKTFWIFKMVNHGHETLPSSEWNGDYSKLWRNTSSLQITRVMVNWSSATKILLCWYNDLVVARIHVGWSLWSLWHEGYRTLNANMKQPGNWDACANGVVLMILVPGEWGALLLLVRVLSHRTFILSVHEWKSMSKCTNTLYK